jgi:hypothetical protein
MKLKISALFTVVLGIISLVWIFYDYLALADIAYRHGGEVELMTKQRMVTIGFIPIILFHFAFFLTMYFLLDYFRQHKQLLLDNKKLKEEVTERKMAGQINVKGEPGKMDNPDINNRESGKRDFTRPTI